MEYQITSNATMVAAMASAYSNGLACGRRNWGNRAMKNTANLGLVTLVAKPERHPETLRSGALLSAVGLPVKKRPGTEHDEDQSTA